MQYIPDFVAAFAPYSESLTMDILDALRSTAAIALNRASDSNCDTTELETAIASMNAHIRSLENSIEAVEQAFDSIRRLCQPDDD